MSAAPTQNQLLKRMTRITFVCGMLVGVLLVFMVVSLNTIVVRHTGISFLTFPLVDGFLYPCTLLVGGILLVLKGRLQTLSMQLEAIWQTPIPTVLGKTRSFVDPVIWGLFIIGLGSLSLIAEIWDLGLSVVWTLIGIVGLLVLCLAIWYQLRRNNRRSTP